MMDCVLYETNRMVLKFKRGHFPTLFKTKIFQ